MFFICRLIDEVAIFTVFVATVKPFKERDVPVLGKLVPCEGSVSVTGVEQGPCQSFPPLEPQVREARSHLLKFVLGRI